MKTELESALKEGNKNYHLKQYSESIKHYTTAINTYLSLKSPSKETVNIYLRLLNRRAASFIRLGKFDNAMRDIIVILKIDPCFAKGYLRRAGVYYFTKRYKDALESYELAMKYNPEYSKRGNKVYQWWLETKELVEKQNL
jgi:tetratricopeptide (TPR) repeat protein